MAIADLLQSCEGTTLAPAYGSPLVELSAAGDILTVSDFHLAGGRSGGVYHGTENFFADEAFHRFLRHVASRAGPDALLIVNGDFVDFIRITDLPVNETDFKWWSQQLAELGIERPIEELRRSIDKRERQYGLKTHDFKSVYKLAVAERGHPAVFRALAEWVAAGHRLVFVKGNHDLEWYWPAVRNCMRLILAKRMASSGQDVQEALRRVLPLVLFVDDRLVVNGELYLEHGHRYDRYARVIGSPAINGEELNLPFGLFLNRYVINKIELDFPFYTKVRPAEKLLPMLFRERFFLGLKVLFYHAPLALLTIPKKYYRYLLRRVLPLAAALVLPLVALAVLLYPAVKEAAGMPAVRTLASLAMPAVSYFAARIVAWLQLAEPDTLAAPARRVLAEHPSVRRVLMGHTHNPEQFEQAGRWYHNTGTWIPVIEAASGALRENRSYVFLEIQRRSGRDPLLECWNDDAQRAEDLAVVDRE